MINLIWILLLIWAWEFLVVGISSLHSVILILAFLAPFITNGVYFRKSFYGTWIVGLLINLIAHYVLFFYNIIDTMHDLVDIGTVMLAFVCFILFIVHSIVTDVERLTDVNAIYSRYKKFSNCLLITGSYVSFALIFFTIKIIKKGFQVHFNLIFIVLSCIIVAIVVCSLIKKFCKEKIVRLRNLEIKQEI